MRLTAQQRTTIRQTVLARSNVPRVNRVDFALSVGTVVPTHVAFAAVPPALIEIHPEWRGHSYFVVDEDIIIVDRSREIVAVVPLGPAQARVGSAAALSLAEDEIREVQLVLIERGFLDGEADGILGPNTRSALIEFQRSEGLQATGRIDTRTVSSLNLSGKINVQGDRGARGAPSTVGRGSDRMQQEQSLRGGEQDTDRRRRGQRDMDDSQRRGQRDMDDSQRRSQRDMDSQRRGQMSPQMREDRSTTGQGPGGERDMSPSTTGKGSGERPAGRSRQSPDAGGPSQSGGAR